MNADSWKIVRALASAIGTHLLFLFCLFNHYSHAIYLLERGIRGFAIAPEVFVAWYLYISTLSRFLRLERHNYHFTIDDPFSPTPNTT